MSDIEEQEELELFCANLSPEVTEEILFELFLQAGPVEEVRLPKDPTTGRNKGFSFIRFKHGVSVPYSINIMNGTKLFNRNLAVRGKNQKRDNNQSNGNNNSNNNNLNRGNDASYFVNENTMLNMPLNSVDFISMPLHSRLLYQSGGAMLNVNNMPQLLQNTVQNNDDITKHSNLSNNRIRHHNSKPYSRNQSPPRRNYQNDRNDRDYNRNNNDRERIRERDYDYGRDRDRSKRHNSNKSGSNNSDRHWIHNNSRR